MILYGQCYGDCSDTRRVVADCMNAADRARRAADAARAASEKARLAMKKVEEMSESIKGGGTLDASQYYTKSEVDTKVSALKATATSTADGMMSAADKKKLDAVSQLSMDELPNAEIDKLVGDISAAVVAATMEEMPQKEIDEVMRE